MIYLYNYFQYKRETFKRKMHAIFIAFNFQTNLLFIIPQFIIKKFRNYFKILNAWLKRMYIICSKIIKCYS